MLNILQKNFRIKPLTAAVASVISLTTASFAYAQDDSEEIVVTGIKASLQAAMDIKRDSAGVVDAISAEDMGKFPDTNLAESLQRITGVSIDRANGEGSKITVRGFGGDTNMVTLNGRVMPAAGVYGGGSGAGGTVGGATRAFDFANLSSDSVAGVEVYKTGKANIATGGIGATVNIKTAKPLETEGFKVSVGAKAINDTTNRTGSDVTPELSGIVSWSDEAGVFGVSLSASHSERDYGNSNATVNDWNIGRWNTATDIGENKGLYSYTVQSKFLADGVTPNPDAGKVNANIVNQPKDGQLYARPNDIRYSFSDAERERDNAQLTLQYKPLENLTTTLDYTYAENDITEHRGEQTIWFANGNSIDNIVFDSSAVASPMLISEDVNGKDHGFEQQYRAQNNKLESTGLNVAWEVNDSFTLTFDAHDSSMESMPTGPGAAGEIAFSMGAPVLTSQYVDYSSDLPTFGFVVDDAVPVIDEDTDEITGYRGNQNGVLDAGDMGSQVARVFYADQTTDITQFKIDGAFKFDDGSFDFGVESRAMETNQRGSDRYMALGDWGIATPGEIPTGLVENFNLAGEYEDYSTTAVSQTGFKGDARELAAWGVSKYGANNSAYAVAANTDFSANNTVEEDTQAVYFQVGVKGELAGMATNLLTGFRYETTDVTSIADVLLPTNLLWQDNNDFQVERQAAKTAYKLEASYDNLLPSLDFDIALLDNLKARFSYSKTIARAGYGSLSPAVANYGTTGSTLNGAQPAATQGNPALKPLESDNLDASVEWYYDDSSYVSAGVFEKRVSNFAGTEQIDSTWFGVKDQTAGPRAQAAVAALEDRGIPVDDTSLFVMMAVLDNPDDFPGGADDYKTEEEQAAFNEDVAKAYDLRPTADDPLTVFRTATPVNNKEAKIYGAEFAVQHFFGETGFGVQANYTLVRGDVGFENAEDPSVSQFALTGLSDTANLVGIYEQDQFQIRIAYNWRDAFLAETNRGNSRNPRYTEAYSQIDLNASYNFSENLSVSLEAINLTGENRRDYGRTTSQLWYLEDMGPRYQLGARYTF